jgi:hypothetical protein
VRRRGQLILEGLSTPRVAARVRVDAVAVLGAHVALSITVAEEDATTAPISAPDERWEGVTALLGFAGLASGKADTGTDTDTGAGLSQGSRHRQRPPRQPWGGGDEAAPPVASEEEQRRFLADLARGRLPR